MRGGVRLLLTPLDKLEFGMDFGAARAGGVAWVAAAVSGGVLSGAAMGRAREELRALLELPRSV